MKTNFILLISTVLLIQFFGCNETKNKNESSAKKSDLVDLNQADTTFGFFWTNFQKAVVNNDFQTLIKLSHFPLETRGPQDEDKIVKYNESEFKVVFETFLKENNDPDLTELDLIKKLEEYDKLNKRDFYVNEDESRVGEMEFRKIDGQWKLTFLYLYYGTIDEIDKKLKTK